MAEQLAVGEVAAGRRAVVGQERRRAAMRSDVNRARHELLAGSALAGDQHGEVVALHPLDLLDDAVHRGAGGQEPGQQRLERSIDRRGRPPPSMAIARGAQREPLARDRGNHSRAAASPDGRSAAARRRGRSAVLRRRGRAARRGRRRRGRRRCRAPTARASVARRVGFAAGGGDHAHVADRPARRRPRCSRPRHASSSAAAVSRPSNSGSAAASTIRRTMASSASAGEITYWPVPTDRQQRLRGVGILEIAFRAELLENRERRD